MAAVRAIRNRRAEMNVAPSKKAHLFIASTNPSLYSGAEEYFKRLAFASGVSVSAEADDAAVDGAVSVVVPNATVYMPLTELIDLAAERKRLQKELENAQKVLSQIDAKLANAGFLAKAPQNVIEAQRTNREKIAEKAALLQAQLQKLVG